MTHKTNVEKSVCIEEEKSKKLLYYTEKCMLCSELNKIRIHKKNNEEKKKIVIKTLLLTYEEIKTEAILLSIYTYTHGTISFKQ